MLSMLSMPTKGVACLLLIGVGSWIIYRTYNILFGQLSSIPSIHWSAPWSGRYNLYLKYFHNIRLIHHEAHISGETGVRPILRIGPNEVSVMDHEAVKAVWGKGFERSPWYQVFHNFGKPNMFSFRHGQDHGRRRRVIAGAYSKTTISQPRTQNIIKECSEKVTDFLRRQDISYSSPKYEINPVVVRNVFRALQSDIFTAFAFSKEDGTRYLDRLREGPNTSEILGMDDMDLLHDERRDKFFFWESEQPFKYLNTLIDRTGPKTHQKAQRWISNIVARYEERVEKSQRSHNALIGDGRSDQSVYGRLHHWKDPHSGKAMDSRDKASEVMDHAVAGQDAVSAALEYLVRQVSIHANVQMQLRAELRNRLPIIASERTFALIDSLPYLNAVIMEGLRTVDTIASYQTRVVPKGGCVICGHYLPEGTIVTSQPYLMNRLPNIFPDPNKFDPSRWLLPQDSYKILANHLWTYSSGPRACIGRELSLAIMKNVLVAIYSQFETSLLNTDRTERRSWEGGDQMAEVSFHQLEILDGAPCKSLEPLPEIGPIGARAASKLFGTEGPVVKVTVCEVDEPC